jgi:hypothetical protein
VSVERKIREVGTGCGEGSTEGVHPRKMQGSGSTAIVQPRSRGGFGNTEALSEREAQATRETLVMRARPPDDILAPNGS